MVHIMFTAMKRYLILLAAVALLAACNKNNDEVQPPTQSTTPKRLASITDISYTQNLNRDYNTGQYVLSYTYGSKSTTTFRWSSAGLPVCFGMDNIDMITIEYNGDKISRIIFSDIIGGSERITDVSCTYDSNNLTEVYVTMVNDVTMANGWSRKTLTYNTDGTLASSRTETNEGDVTTTTLEWENGNVMRETTTHTNSHSSYTSTRIRDYLYDNKTSYYTGMENFALIMGSEGYSMLSRNNVLRETRDGSTTVYTYTYNGDWPITVSTLDNDDYYSHESTSYLHYTDGSGASEPQTYRIHAKSNLQFNTAIYVLGSGDYEAGRQVMLRAATSLADTAFVRWSDGVTDNPRSITATCDAEYIAVFDAIGNK